MLVQDNNRQKPQGGQHEKDNIATMNSNCQGSNKDMTKRAKRKQMPVFVHTIVRMLRMYGSCAYIFVLNKWMNERVSIASFCATLVEVEVMMLSESMTMLRSPDLTRKKFYAFMRTRRENNSTKNPVTY